MPLFGRASGASLPRHLRHLVSDLDAMGDGSGSSLVHALATIQVWAPYFQIVRWRERHGQYVLDHDDEYVLAMINALGGGFDAAVASQALEEDVELRDTTFWRIFEVHGTKRVNLAYLDQYRGDFGHGWDTSVRLAVADGTLDRERVLTACSNALSRDFPAVQRRWFERLRASLSYAPSAVVVGADTALAHAAEGARRGRSLMALCGSAGARTCPGHVRWSALHRLFAARSAVHRVQGLPYSKGAAINADGSVDRRKRTAKTHAEVVRKVRKLEQERHDGNLVPAGQSPRLEAWLEEWLAATALRVRPSTLAGYTVDVRRHIGPIIGKHRLLRLEPEHVEHLYQDLLANGLNAGSVHHVRRTLNKALNDAVRRRRIPRNPVTLAHTPRYDAPDIVPLTVPEAKKLLAAAREEPNGAAFMLAISLGLRRGEVPGLRWADVDLDHGRLHVRHQLERRNWKHGCLDPERCDERPSRCPDRVGGGLILTELKTKGSRRTLPLPQPLIDALRAHRQRQREARIHAGSVWANSEMVFTTITGRPVAPRDHSVHWTEFLEAAGVRPARLHDARHTAATFLLVQGVDQRVVMSMFGWTSTAMTTRYQHVVPELVEEANRRMTELLWDGAGHHGSEGA